MMLSSSLAVFSLLLVVLGFANALPTDNNAEYRPPPPRPRPTKPSPRPPSPTGVAPTCVQPTLTANETAWSTKRFISANLPDPLKEAPIFWSGQANNQSVVSIAERCGASVHGATVGMMMCENGHFTMPNSTTPAAHELWNYASEIFANHTAGRAYTVLGSTVNPSGTWVKVELPALKRNKRVTSVVQLNRTTCANDCYWYCTEPKNCAGIKPCEGA
ncbi:hypothetical protein BDQ12DRAFT_733706 [Crucibulum laeve]|uniref:Uncharacterized protein n=1 Tax=Crucibulum laeve TaxID=68775 RepID=A0A5C3M6Z5_9AGAR|nr:hypothetical protein BDQ12DRAFT_733706 [Crucibulum laeve]